MKGAAQQLYEVGRAHALSGNHLYGFALEYAKRHDIEDAEKFAFNGTFSLSTYYLLGLGIELLLKAAYVALGGDPADKHLRAAIGHDLRKAWDRAVGLGFESKAPRLEGIVDTLSEPYKMHFFRYQHPEQMGLPLVTEVVEALEVLDAEVQALIDNLPNQ